FGQLYLNNGLWEGKEIISKQWIKKSFDKYYFLENTFDKNEYGYLFWHKTYNAKGRKITSIEARGSGGQYLFIIPEYELVVVITSGNYRNNRGFQPELIMEKYILPEFVK
ncbi:MAG: serine hydrolase, partial [Candidatus Kapaibacterium sp.]